jgi:hypothetical protein
MSITSGAARISAGAIALIGWAGLATQFSATFHLTGSLADSLWVMLRYFTILTNLLVAVVLTGIALGRSAFGSPTLLGGATLAIILVGIIYSLLLRGLMELSGGAMLADFILHDVVPVLAPLFWLFFAPKRALRIRDPLLWSLYPLFYVAYALARGAAENRYAYPFIDVGRIGWLQTGSNCLLIMLGFLAAGFALTWLDRLLGRRLRQA